MAQAPDSPSSTRQVAVEIQGKCAAWDLTPNLSSLISKTQQAAPLLWRRGVEGIRLPGLPTCDRTIRDLDGLFWRQD